MSSLMLNQPIIWSGPAYVPWPGARPASGLGPSFTGAPSAPALLRQEFALKAAQLGLGHASPHIRDGVCAERDRGRVIGFMRKFG